MYILYFSTYDKYLYFCTSVCCTTTVYTSLPVTMVTMPVTMVTMPLSVTMVTMSVTMVSAFIYYYGDYVCYHGNYAFIYCHGDSACYHGVYAFTVVTRFCPVTMVAMPLSVPMVIIYISATMGTVSYIYSNQVKFYIKYFVCDSSCILLMYYVN